MGYGFADFIATQKTKQRLKLWLAGWNYGVTKRKTNKLALIASPYISKKTLRRIWRYQAHNYSTAMETALSGP